MVSVSAWDFNCPQHLPQKLDARDVAAIIARREARITELAAENRRLVALGSAGVR